VRWWPQLTSTLEYLRFYIREFLFPSLITLARALKFYFTPLEFYNLKCVLTFLDYRIRNHLPHKQQKKSTIKSHSTSTTTKHNSITPISKNNSTTWYDNNNNYNKIINHKQDHRYFVKLISSLGSSMHALILLVQSRIKISLMAWTYLTNAVSNLIGPFRL
jgi:hypothetical protein